MFICLAKKTSRQFWKTARHTELQTELPPDHPFEIIKRKLYVKNHASVHTETLGHLTVVHHTVAVKFQANEAAFYHSREQATGGRPANLARLYDGKHEELRRLCCHPAASTELQELFGGGGSGGGGTAGMLAQRGFTPETIDSLANKVVRGRSRGIEESRAQVTELTRHIKCAVNSVAICEAIQQRGINSGQATHAAGVREVTGSDSLLASLCAETSGDVCMRNAQHDDRKGGGGSATSGREFIHGDQQCVEFIKQVLSNEAGFRQFLTNQRTYITTHRPMLLDASRKLSQGESQHDYFSQIIAAIGKTGNDGMECSVCFEPSLMLAFPACGHYTCSPCMDKWLLQSSNCPQCRKQLVRHEVLSVNCGALGRVDGAAAELAQQCVCWSLFPLVHTIVYHRGMWLLAVVPCSMALQLLLHVVCTVS